MAVSELARSRGKRTGGSKAGGAAAARFKGALALGAIALAAGAGLLSASQPVLADVVIGGSVPVQADGNSIEFSNGSGTINFQDGGVISGLTAQTLASGGTHAATTGQLWQVNEDLLQTAQDLATVTTTVSGLNTTVGNHTTQIATHTTQIGNLQTASNASVRYDSATTKNLITLEGSGAGTRITNLADGSITSGSKDAVTGGQMYTLEQKLYSQGEGVKYFHANSSLDDSEAVGSESIAIGPEAVSAGEASIAAGIGASTTGTAEAGIALGQGATAGTEGGAVADGVGSIAIGRDSQASGNSTVALGDGATVEDERVNNALALGSAARVSGNQSHQAVAIGHEAHASAANATALGASALASGTGAIALGDATAGGPQSLAAGVGAFAGTRDSIALGTGSGVGSGTEINDPGQRHSFIAIGKNAGRNMDGNQAIAIGVGAGASTIESDQIAIGTQAGTYLEGERNVSIGFEANKYDAGPGGARQGIRHATAIGGTSIAATDAVAVGYGAHAITAESIAIGSGSLAQAGSIALGHNSHAVQVTGVGYLIGEDFTGESVSVGNAGTGLTRRITNVEDGADGYDAVNVRQLQALEGRIGSIIPTPGGDVNYNPGNTITVAAGTAADHAVNVAQMNTAIADGKPKFYSVNPNGDAMNQNGDGALGPNSANSMAIGHAAKIDEAERATAVGYSVLVKAADGTAIGSGSTVNNTAGVAIGQGAYSRGDNSIAMGTNAQTERKDTESTSTNAIAIGTSSRATDDSASALGHHATASGERSSALGYMANASGTSAMAFGTQSAASGVDSQASGTRADATRDNAQASGTDAKAYATDGIAIGTGAMSGQASPAPEDAAGNIDTIAIGHGALAIRENAYASGTGANATAVNAMAMGAGSVASAQSAVAIGRGANAGNERAVALGDGAQTAGAVGTTNASLNGIAYGNFAGASPIATVSVGTDQDKRTITNVAAGRISNASTDAINGSQLYATNVVLGNVANTTKNILGGNAALASNGGLSMSNIGDTGENTVHDAIKYAAQGWNISADGDTATNVAPGGAVDFGNTDDNILITRGSAGLSFNLADDIEIGNSITVGDTVINGDRITAKNLTIEGETRLGDNFVVNNAGDVTYNGSEVATQADGLSFRGNTGGTIAKTLGDTAPLTISGGLAASEASTGANLRVDSDGTQLNLVMARNLTDLDSITINNGGPVINGGGIDMGGKKITNLAIGTDPTDAVNLSQLDAVSDVANAGWYVGVNSEATGANVAPNAKVDFSNDDENIVITRAGTDLKFNLNSNIDLGAAGSLTTGQTVVNNAGVAVGDDVALTDAGLRVDGATPDTYTDLAAGNFTVAGGGNTIIINGANGTIAGLTNQTTTYTGFADGSGRAATEEQLDEVKGGVDDITDRAVKYDLNPDGSVNYNVVTMEGTPGTATKDPGTGRISTTGGTQITNVASAGDYTNANNALNAVNAGDLNNAVQDVTSAGLNFSANAGADVHRNLGQTLAIRGGMADATPASATSGENVITRTTADGINIELAKDVVFDSVTTGDTVMDTDGVRIGTDIALSSTGLRAGTVVISSTTGDITGLSNTTLTAPGFGTAGRAATEEQLQLARNETQELADRAVKYDLNPDNTVNYGKVTMEGDVSTDGGRTGGTQITNVARGDISENSTDAVNGSQIHDMGNSIADGMGGNSKFVDGKLVTELNVGGDTYNNVNDALNGVQTNIDEVAQVANAGWQIQANGDQASKVAPGKTVEFIDGDNIEITRQTSADGNNQVKVSMSKDIKVDTVTANKVTTKEVAIENGPTINQDGIDMNDQRVTNMADGVNDRDAVNVGQLNKATGNITNQINRLDGRVNRVENRANAGVASALAAAALPQAYLPGKSMFSLGGGTWNGETGYAMGLSTVSDNGKWLLKGSAVGSSRGDYGAAVGVGYQW